MSFMSALVPGQVVNNDQLVSIFKCSSQGGMRRAHKTGSLLLISNHVDSIYDDRWIDDVLHYTGMGSKGDQSLDSAQNKTLNQSGWNGVIVFLFEVFRGKEYTYRGQVELCGQPYSERQPDINGHDRLVWVFQLRLVDGNDAFVAKAAVESLAAFKEKKARRLTNEEILKRAMRAKGRAGSRAVIASQHERNPWVAEYVKRRANGVCELCRSPAPFSSSDGVPYLECHHVEWLSNNGDDSIENTVAICPNCHRKMHILNDSADLKLLKKVCREEAVGK